MRYLPEIAFVFLIIVALGVIVGAVRAFVMAIRAYRTATDRGVAPMWAAGGAIVLGVSLVLATTAQLKSFRTAPSQPPPGQSPQPPPTAPVRPPDPPGPIAATVTVNAKPPGAQVTLDGESLGLAPIAHEFLFEPRPGRSVMVVVSKPGFEHHSFTFTPSAREPSKVIDVTLNRSKSTLVHVESAPAGAEVRLDGERKGTTPLDVELRWPPMNQTVEVMLDGHFPERRVINPKDGLDQTLDLKLRQGASLALSCGTCESGAVFIDNVYRTLPTTVTVEPNSKKDVVLSLANGKLIKRTVTSGALGSVTRVTID